MKQEYDVLTDIFPRKHPAGKGAVLQLTDEEATFPLLSGDIALKKPVAPATKKQPVPASEATAG